MRLSDPASSIVYLVPHHSCNFPMSLGGADDRFKLRILPPALAPVAFLSAHPRLHPDPLKGGSSG